MLTGAGRGFCSGQNLKAAQILGDDIAAGVMKYYWPTFKALRECRVPVVVAVNGVAAGGGLQPCDGGRHDRCRAVGALHSGVQPHRAGPRSRLDLAVAAPRRPAARARTDDDQRAAHGRSGQEWGLVREVFDDAALRDGALVAGAQTREAGRRARWSRRAA